MFLLRLLSAPIHHQKSRLANMSSLSYLKRVSSTPSSPPQQQPQPISKYESDPSSIHNKVMMLIKLSNLDAAAEQARLAVLAKGEPKVTAATCVAIIEAMRSERRYSDAYDLFDYFASNSDSDLIPNICCGPLISIFCDEGKLDEALELYKEFLGNDDLSFGPSSSRVKRVLSQGLADAGRVDEAMDLFYCVSRYFYEIFTRGFLDIGNLERANQLFQELKSSGDLDIVARVSARFVEHWFQQGLDEKAMECYNKEFSKRSRMGIDVVAGNTLLRVLLKYGKKTEAWSLFSEMLEGSRFPELPEYRDATRFNSESCNIMVNECFEVGKMSKAVEIFDNVVDTISKPQLCYRNMITRFCEQGMLSEAESCFDEMRSKDYLVPDIPTYRAMTDAYAKEVRVSDALKTVNQSLDASLTYIAKRFSS